MNCKDTIIFQIVEVGILSCGGTINTPKFSLSRFTNHCHKTLFCDFS